MLPIPQRRCGPSFPAGLRRGVAIWCSVIAALVHQPLLPAADRFALVEYLGRDWTGELVSFPVDGALDENLALIGPNGDSVPWQWSEEGGVPHLAFQADLPAGETIGFALDDSRERSRETDLVIEQSDEFIRLHNGLVGVELARFPTEGNGPVRAIRLNSGRWVGGSRLETDLPVTGWDLEVAASGPVFVDARCRVRLGQSHRWNLRFRVLAGEPVVLVDESFNVSGRAEFRLLLDRNFDASTLFFRHGSGNIGKNDTWEIEKGPVYILEPWLRWWEEERQGACFGVFGPESRDLLSLAAGHAGAWVDPDLPPERRAPPRVLVSLDESGLAARFPLREGQRRWQIGAFDRDTCLRVLTEASAILSSPPPYRALIKHGHFPLDTIKDYVLDWPAEGDHPRLLVSDDDLERYRSRVGEGSPDAAAQVETYLRSPNLLIHQRLDEAVPLYVTTGDARLGRLFGERALQDLQSVTRLLLDQKGLPFGAAPHHHSAITSGLHLADVVMGTPGVSDQVRREIRVQAAFLAYTLARPEYWSPERDYGGNPNMTTSVNGYRARLAAFIRDHPAAEEWFDEAYAELLDQLRTWSDARGGWKEAPHYAMVSYDEILSLLLVAHRNGRNDHLYAEPKARAVMEWFAQIATPPDSRIGGFRHFPPIGNTYVHEPSGQYGIAAFLFQESHPEFSARMQWMFRQNDEFGWPGIGGFFPAFSGYRRILTDPALPEKVPDYRSVSFPQTGTVLRHAYASGRESYLHLIHGENHEHYDFDSGSVILYAMGRVLADDFGYNGRAPREQHNMVDAPQANEKRMRLRTFERRRDFDYVEGVKGGWTRRILMSKPREPHVPPAFVLRDTLEQAEPAVWRCWFTATSIRREGNTFRVIGKEDVDLDLHFTGAAELGRVTIEEKTVKGGAGLLPDWSWGRVEVSQIGLIVEQEGREGWTVLMVPRLKSQSPTRFVTDNASTFPVLPDFDYQPILQRKGAGIASKKRN